MSCRLSNARVLALFLCVVSQMGTGCKNVTQDQRSVWQEGPESVLDYSYVKFATYSGDVVLSAGEYLGNSSKAEVIWQAHLDLKSANGNNCDAGTRTSFCSLREGDQIEWIQLFMPDSSSCSVGPAPEGVEVLPCPSPVN